MLNPLVAAIPINLLIIYCIVIDIIDYKKGKRKTYKRRCDYVDVKDNKSNEINYDRESIINTVTALTSAVMLAILENGKVD